MINTITRSHIEHLTELGAQWIPSHRLILMAQVSATIAALFSFGIKVNILMWLIPEGKIVCQFCPRTIFKMNVYVETLINISLSCVALLVYSWRRFRIEDAFNIMNLYPDPRDLWSNDLLHFNWTQLNWCKTSIWVVAACLSLLCCHKACCIAIHLCLEPFLVLQRWFMI